MPSQYYYFFPFLILCLLFTACEEESNSCEELPDLQGDLINSGGSTILAGETYDFDHVVRNAEAVFSDQENCTFITTMDAGESIAKITVSSMSQNDSLIVNQDDTIRGLGGGNSQGMTYEALFSVPGEYRITAISDNTKIVEERNEDNNTNTGLANAGRLAPGYTNLNQNIKTMLVKVEKNPEINTDSLLQKHGLVKLTKVKTFYNYK